MRRLRYHPLVTLVTGIGTALAFTFRRAMARRVLTLADALLLTTLILAGWGAWVAFELFLSGL